MNGVKVGERVFRCSVSDKMIVKAAGTWLRQSPPAHEDAPELDEVLELRRILSVEAGGKLDMLCPLWLRNKFVQVRKAGLLKGKATVFNR